jgi:hypothetical protein
MRHVHTVATTPPRARSEAVEPIALAPEARARTARLAETAGAGAASVLAQMTRAPVPAPRVSVRILSAKDACDLPQLSGHYPVLVHRSLVGDLPGDIMVAQSPEMVRWLASSLPSLGAADLQWATRRLADLAGVSLAAFALALGRAAGARLEPDWHPGRHRDGAAGVLADAVARNRVALCMETVRPSARSIGDFYLLADRDAVARFLAMSPEGE